MSAYTPPNQTLHQSHELLDRAGISGGDREDILPLTERIGLLIDERNSLKDELEGLHKRERIADRSGYAYHQDDALVDD